MVRYALVGFVFTTLPFLLGCEAAGQRTPNNDDWFKRNNEAFERQHAEHVKQSSKAVSGYQQYRNR